VRYVAESHEETAFPKPKKCRHCGRDLETGASRCTHCGQETAEPRSLLVIGLIALFVAAVGVTVAYLAIRAS